jgi:hypothetical protein
MVPFSFFYFIAAVHAACELYRNVWSQGIFSFPFAAAHHHPTLSFDIK